MGATIVGIDGHELRGWRCYLFERLLRTEATHAIVRLADDPTPHAVALRAG